jgi:hypothetical protein
MSMAGILSGLKGVASGLGSFLWQIFNCIIANRNNYLVL